MINRKGWARVECASGIQCTELCLDEPDAIRNGKVFRTVPAGIVKLQNNDAIAASAGLSREGGEQLGKERLVDSVGEIPHRRAARGRDETGYVEPFVAMVTERDRPHADRRPNPAMRIARTVSVSKSRAQA